jgi:chromosome segregation ATPase
MKAILYVIAILAIGGAAYFSFDHSQKFATLEKERIAAIATHKELLADTAIAEKGVKEETAKLNASKESRDLLTQTVSSLKSTGSSLSLDPANLKKDLKVQEEELAQLQKALEEVNAVLANLGGGVTIDTLPAKIKEIEEDKKARQAKLEELVTLATGAEPPR